MSSQECDDIHKILVAGVNNQDTNVNLKELESSKAIGRRLGVDFQFTDEIIMKKIIEIEAKGYTLSQRNSSAR